MQDTDVKKQLTYKKLERAKNALEKNHMNAYIAKDREEAFKILKSFLKQGCRVAVSGSVTLREAGIMSYVEQGLFVYTNRYKKDTFEINSELSEEMVRQSFLDAYTADVYLAGTNAITEQGELVNVDGNGNRISALSYGPSQVVIVIGSNKVVFDLAEALQRIRRVAAPANNMRYQNHTPCTRTGICMDCKSEFRICCNYSVIGFQKNKDRIHIILVNEEMGY